MGLEIVCVERVGKKGGHRHITAIGVDTTKVVIRFSVKTVRRIIKEGAVDFYCLGPDGEEVTVRRYKCRCGVKTIRTDPDDLSDGCLSLLPTYSELTKAGPPVYPGDGAGAVGAVTDGSAVPGARH